jgi:two-component system, response regulator YesN
VLRLPDLIFKREVGMTFERYLMTARVERSKRALLDPLNTVAAVAEQIGFMDPAYYAKVFRKITGCSPTEYRENPALYPIRNVSLRVS